MKRVTIILTAIIVALAFPFSSCKKCTTCTEKNTGYTSDYCGTSKQVKDFEKELKDEGSKVGQDWECEAD